MSLAKSFALARFAFKYNPVLYTAVRNHWNKDNKPGAFPKTEQERLAAAKRYGLLPQEYEPYPDDGVGSGDYPKLPDISGDAKDPYYPYDFPALKRNFQEPIHVEQELLGEDRYDISKRHRVPAATQWIQFFGVIGGCFAVYIVLQRYPMFHALAPKQYPGKGKHYTFETD